MRRRRAVVKHVAEMGVALRAGNRCSCHEITGVRYGLNILRSDRIPEAGPPGSGVKLGLRAEQRIVTADAAVQAFFVQVPIFPAESHFGVGMAGDVESVRGELLAPLLVGLDHFAYAGHSQALAGVRKLHDIDLLRRSGGTSRLDRARPSHGPESDAGQGRGRGREKRAAAELRGSEAVLA